MRTQLIAVGNSKGIRLPKAILGQYGIADAVDITLTEQGILLSPVCAVRENWEAAILADAEESGKEFQDFAALETAFDEGEWIWPKE